MKNFYFLIIIAFVFVLSGCSKLTDNSVFDKKVKCYELGRQRINDLKKELVDRIGKETQDGYYINGIFLNDEYKTCFLDYTHYYYNIDDKYLTDKYIEDLLTSQSVSSAMNDDTSYFKMRDKLINKEEYKYLKLYEEEK